MVLLEVCIDSYERGVEAFEKRLSLQTRLELCSDLQHEGFTPEDDLIEDFLGVEAISPTRIINVMIRPRRDTACVDMIQSFCYSSSDVEEMKQQIRHVKSIINKFNGRKSMYRIGGFVMGCLCVDGESVSIDEEAVEELIQTIREDDPSYSITFHKAFDLVTNPMESLKFLHSKGINRVLTSLCFAQKDLKGKVVDAIRSGGETLCNFLECAKSAQITLLLGGGVREHNAQEIVFFFQDKEIPFELHSSTSF